MSYQGVLGLVLVEGAEPGPVELLEEGEAGLVELALRGHDPEEVGEAARREHRVRVRVGQLGNTVGIYSILEQHFSAKQFFFI